MATPPTILRNLTPTGSATDTMALHVRHKIKDSVQGRICLSTACVVLCAMLFIHSHSITFSVPPKNKAATVYSPPQPEQPQKQETTAPRVELSTQPPAEPEPICIIDTPPVMPESEAPYIPTGANLAEGIGETTDEYLFYSELTPQFEEAPHTQARVPAPETALTYTPPQYAATPQPPYPRELLRRRVEGSVRVRIHIDPQGKPLAVEIISATHPAFAKAAKQTILSAWRFHPAHNGPSPVSATVVTTVRFVM